MLNFGRIIPELMPVHGDHNVGEKNFLEFFQVFSRAKNYTFP